STARIGCSIRVLVQRVLERSTDALDRRAKRELSRAVVAHLRIPGKAPFPMPVTRLSAGELGHPDLQFCPYESPKILVPLRFKSRVQRESRLRFATCTVSSCMIDQAACLGIQLGRPGFLYATGALTKISNDLRSLSRHRMHYCDFLEA